MTVEDRPQRIVLLRHGESQGNVDDTVYERVPDHALELTERGVGQARETGRALAALGVGAGSRVWASPYRRVRQTLAALEVGIDLEHVRWEPRLREQDWANFQDPADIARQREVRDRYGHFHYRFTHGESGADVYDRVSDFLESLFRDLEAPGCPDTVLLASHGLTMRLFCMRWFHWSVELFESLENPRNAGYVALERQPDYRYRMAAPFERWDTSYEPTARERASWV
ncbi:histidine phosphatase family protein [Lapillicoccus jejuensis]|uniref:Broad specificity phosphatase PhoE n=1 Tax=Lapillicoccus jejuensis TaxID=402171 RepID=A0A542DZT1_9MICO|nr:histidine phosphatase family protein [Lapillicoccus jejuensis]TQJ08576.1 broad specificity phosphatase PhoE [Lapillicoccus jejuensis]